MKTMGGKGAGKSISNRCASN